MGTTAIQRLDELARTRSIGFAAWGGDRYNNGDTKWHIEMTLRKGDDKFECKGLGESLEEAAQAILDKYDAITMGVPMMTPRLLVTGKSEPAF